MLLIRFRFVLLAGIWASS